MNLNEDYVSNFTGEQIDNFNNRITTNTNNIATNTNNINNYKNQLKAKITTQTFTTSQYGWITFPNDKIIISAMFNTYCYLFIIQREGNACIARAYVNTNSIGSGITALSNNTSYSVTYSYLEKLN